MTEPQFFEIVLYTWMGLAGVTFVSLFFITAPYGRYTRQGFGPSLDRRLGWILMELPSATLVAAMFLASDRLLHPAAIVFVVLWCGHYWLRTFVFPFRMRGDAKRITLLPVLMGFVFNLGNAYLNGRYLFFLSDPYPASWLADPRFLLGTGLFLLGFAINQHADQVLRNLRAPGETGYKVPHGGLYRLVSCPNYLGEILEWFGWALATWSLAGLSFALFTVANLAPRAWSHHQWYKKKFQDYPSKRRAVIPWLF